MNGRDEELLSAYYDGELPDEERVRAEQLLADNVGAREVLDEVADVSGWIRELPRATAPPGLHDEVLARIRSTTAARPLKPAPARSSWRRWAGWTAVSAAGLLVAAVLFRQEFEQIADPLAGRPLPLRESEESRDEMAGVVASRSDAATADHLRRFAADSVESQRVNFVQMAISNSLQIQDQLAEQLKTGQPPVAGEEYTNLVQVGDRVVAVKCRIVDIEKLPGALQLVLTNNGIAEVPGAQSGGSTFEFKDGAQQLHAFYVEAPEPNFTSAMTDITNLNGVMAVSENSFVAADTANVNAGAPETTLNEGTESLAARRVRTAAAAPTPADQPALVTGSAPPSASERAAEAGDESRPASEAGTTVALGAVTEGRAAEAGAAPPTDGYQVAVSARAELIQELQEQEELFFDKELDGLENRPATLLPQQQQLAKRTQNRNWGLRKSRVQGPPPAPNWVRAVILLVPDEPQ